MTDLSPAAQAVLDAYINGYGWLDGPFKKDYLCVAAILRVAADHLGSCNASTELLAIAEELEGQ
jgi:hypothetical protein